MLVKSLRVYNVKAGFLKIVRQQEFYIYDELIVY